METDKRDYVGVDPDSKGYEMFGYREGRAEGYSQYFKSSFEGMQQAMKWLSKLNQPVIGIEGIHGRSRELERWLQKEGLNYYSIPPFRIDKYRQAAIGQNKNNRNDAASVALFVESMHRQDKLNDFEPKKETDYELRKLTRLCIIKSQEETAVKNRFWKVINEASTDLYLYLCGDTEEDGETRLDKICILNLLYNQPDLSRWKELKNYEWYEAFGRYNFKSREKILQGLKKASMNITRLEPSTILVLTQMAEDIIRLKRHQQALKQELVKLTKDNAAVKYLEGWHGIGNYSASCLIAEILDIRRFRNDDALACYSGLGRREHKTGVKEDMRRNYCFNRYLKSVMINSAMLYVKWNKESAFAYYYKHLLKKGMKKIEARKRVGRAFLRKVYRELKMLNIDKNEKDGMAKTGSRPNGQIVHKSNIPPSRNQNNIIAAKSQIENKVECLDKMLC
jgi:transposase